MKTVGEDDIERQLNRLAPRPIPPGLRERVLGPARRVREEAALSPRLRLAAVACVVLTAAVLSLGRFVGNREAERLSVLLDGRQATTAAWTGAGELAEMAGLEKADAERLIKLFALASSPEGEKRQSRLDEGQRGLKGWSDYETYENPN